MTTKLKPMTVQDLIDFLNTVKNKNAIVGVACDSEGNGFSAIPNQQFYSVGYLENKLGYAEFEEEPFDGYVPVIILWGSN